MNQKTKNLVGAGVFTAIVLVLQFLGGTFQIGGLNINVSLVPIVVGAAIYGWKVGAWLGLVSGGVILIAGQAAAFLTVNPLGTVITVLVKGTLCGLIAGLVYTALSKKNQWLGGGHRLPGGEHGCVPAGLPGVLHGHPQRLGCRSGL